MPIMEDMNNHHHHHKKRQTPGGNLDNICNIGSPKSTVDSKEKKNSRLKKFFK